VSFISSFQKIAEEMSPSEKESVKKVEELGLKYLPSLSQLEDRDHDIKVGARVYYYGETGWKYGEDAAHTKSCSYDKEVIDPKREAYEETLKKKGTKPDWNAPEHPNRKFEGHHNGDWKTQAVRNGDCGRIVKIDAVKSGYRSANYDVRWDRHPDCVWGHYRGKELKLAGAPFETSWSYLVRESDKLPEALTYVQKKADELGAKLTVVRREGWPSGWKGIRKEIIFKSSNKDIIKFIADGRYFDPYLKELMFI
jgi:hypothetical protein